MNIKQMQWQLRFLGCYSGEIDGIWGQQSQLGTIRFQQEFSLTPTGLFREEEERRSSEVIADIQRVVTEYNPTALAIDGLAGPKTMAATVRYQQAVGLTPDGIAGPLTRAAIDREGQQEDQTDDFWATIPHFVREEFACPCGRCGGFPKEPNRKLVRLAQVVRQHFDAPVYISSGVRCEARNAAVGGKINSRHLGGDAMDYRVEGQTAAQVLTFVQTLPVRYAYAIDGNYVHMDVQ